VRKEERLETSGELCTRRQNLDLQSLLCARFTKDDESEPTFPRGNRHERQSESPEKGELRHLKNRKGKGVGSGRAVLGGGASSTSEIHCRISHVSAEHEKNYAERK